MSDDLGDQPDDNAEALDNGELGWDGEPEGTNPGVSPAPRYPEHWDPLLGTPQDRTDHSPDGLVRVMSDDADTELVYQPDGTVVERERTVVADGDVPDLGDGDLYDPDADPAGPSALAAAHRGVQWVSTNVPRPPLWTPPQAVAQARLQVTHDTCPHYNGYGGLCLHFCACMYGFASSGTYDAVSMWRLMPEKYCHYEDHSPPVGALVMWGGGSAGHGHICIVVAPGMIASNDIRRYGRIDVVPLSEISARWGEDYKGWTPPYFARGAGTNGQHPVVSAQPPNEQWAGGDVYVRKLRMGQRQSDSVRRLKHRLIHHEDLPKGVRDGVDLSNGDYGGGTRDAVQWWQRHVADFGGGRADDRDGRKVTDREANRLFGDKYRVIETDGRKPAKKGGGGKPGKKAPGKKPGKKPGKGKP